MAQCRGDFATAQALHTESIEIYRDLGDRQAVASVATNLGLVASRQGDYRAARTLYEQSIADFTALGDRWGMAWSLEGLATVAWGLADPPRAARIWGAAQRIRGEIGCPLPPSERPYYDRDVAAARAAMGSGDFDAAWAEGRLMTAEQALQYALGQRGP